MPVISQLRLLTPAQRQQSEDTERPQRVVARNSGPTAPEVTQDRPGPMYELAEPRGGAAEEGNKAGSLAHGDAVVDEGTIACGRRVIEYSGAIASLAVARTAVVDKSAISGGRAIVEFGEAAAYAADRSAVVDKGTVARSGNSEEFRVSEACAAARWAVVGEDRPAPCRRAVKEGYLSDPTAWTSSGHKVLCDP